MSAEDKDFENTRVWKIQWSEMNSGPQFIFAKNKTEAMNKFAKRFSKLSSGTVQIESIKEVDWNTIREDINEI